MELCARHSLREWLLYYKNRDKIDILKIIGQITVDVEYIHSKGLIHRDLKPSNIFFSLDNQIKIGDFGLVTKIINSDSETEYDDKQHTDQVGTQFYMSPEQMILGNSYDFKVDIYSLGIIFIIF
ncbi:eukaryotic translation initiation factor 2-alpha kinase-like [Acyrthosiphon pisum]|uniref:Protein kinase domain-containing protein n=1 Tax=Acyrthosiphon pisum TaxID=7029 RepID=A0A8R2NLD8_ACYPI|nr:eukaryotic translation initiation factor 2-alpha kinase-like [Acyrthosiphon pisum]